MVGLHIFCVIKESSINVIKELDTHWPATGEWWAPWGAERGLYSFPSKPIVCSRLVTVEAGICSYWEVKSNPECLYPLCTVCEHKAGDGISVKTCSAHELAIDP